MARLDGNIDACRLSTDVLTRIRKVVRDSLHATYGASWEEAGIPADIREFLLQRQAREASINWNLSDSCDALDFAGYLNLSDIIAATPGLLQRFLSLAPDANVVRTKFLELDTILNRIGYARPISEADLGLLATFDDRMKKILAGPAPVLEDVASPRARRDRTSRPAPEPAPAPVIEFPEPAVASPTGEIPVTAQAQPPAPTPPEPLPEVVAPEPTSAPLPQATAAPEPAHAPSPVAAAPQVGPEDLETAIKQGQSKMILTALYQEVTSLADGLWNGSVTTLQARAWEKVRESTWYREQFAKLGLKPISDFFGLFDSAREKSISGASRTQLQDFLKEHNFVQVLLALKELFRQHVRP
jgi:hypothetical protein